MAYREAADAPCYVCDRRPATPCDCCHRDRCAKHDAEDEPGWCRRCGDELYMWMRKDDSGPGMFVYMAGFVPLAIGTVAWTPLGIAAIAYAFLGVPVMAMLIPKRKRRRFIAHVRKRGELPERSEPVSDADAELARYERQMHLRIEERTGRLTEE